MDEQQLSGGHNWQDSHPALQSSHARGALFFYSKSVVTSFFCFLLVSFFFIFIPRILLFALSCLFLFNMTISSERNSLMVGSEEINNGPFDGEN